MPKTGESNGDGTYENLDGKGVVSFVAVSDKVLDKTDFREESIPVRMKGAKGTATLPVPMHPSNKMVLKPYFSGTLPKEEVPTREEALRGWLTRHFPKDEEFWVQARDGWINQILLPPGGPYRVKLHNLRQYVNAKHEARILFILCDDVGRETVWSTPYPDFDGQVGEDAAGDYIDFKSGSWAMKYLAALGLDMEKLVKEWEESDGFPHQYDGQGDPVEPYFFRNPDNIVPELLQAVVRHGLKPIAIEIEDDETYGPSAVRIGGKGNDRLFVKLMYVAEEEKEAWDAGQVEAFYKAYQKLTKKVLGKKKVFAEKDGAGMAFTEDGITVAKMTLVPLVGEKPWMVTTTKEDGTPAIYPPESDCWTMDGVVLASMVAETLLRGHKEGDIDLGDPTDVVGNTDKFLEWLNVHFADVRKEPL